MAFEVASIRMVSPYSLPEIDKGLGNNPIGPLPANRFTARHVTLKNLIAYAFGWDEKYLQDSPGWMDSQEYDIEAKVSGDEKLDYEQMKPLIQTLLRERFHLVTRVKQNPISGYVLRVAKSGPKLKTSKPDATTSMYFWSDHIYARSTDTKSLAFLLVRSVGAPVSDETGLSGTYDVVLHFRRLNDLDSNLPDIFTAVQEQLGLKLVPGKVPVKYLVIDHVDRIPTEN